MTENKIPDTRQEQTVLIDSDQTAAPDQGPRNIIFKPELFAKINPRNKDSQSLPESAQATVAESQTILDKIRNLEANPESKSQAQTIQLIGQYISEGGDIARLNEIGGKAVVGALEKIQETIEAVTFDKKKPENIKALSPDQIKSAILVDGEEIITTKDGRTISIKEMALVGALLAMDTAFFGGRALENVAQSILDRVVHKGMNEYLQSVGFDIPMESEKSLLYNKLLGSMTTPQLKDFITNLDPASFGDFLEEMEEDDRVSMLAGQDFGGILGIAHKFDKQDLIDMKIEEKKLALNPGIKSSLGIV